MKIINFIIALVPKYATKILPSLQSKFAVKSPNLSDARVMIE
jgi:hypothetical protein